METENKMKPVSILMIPVLLALLYSCKGMKQSEAILNMKIDSLEKELLKYKAEKLVTEMRLVRFDSLDFYIYNNKRWDDFDISHSVNIVVHYPDRTTTVGLTPLHLESMKPQFVFAPDTRIVSHPVKFGSGDWTAVIGEMEGTFTKPMTLDNGKIIPPTGKKFMVRMCTIGHWEGGKLTEEYLFWDNESFKRQIGI